MKAVGSVEIVDLFLKSGVNVNDRSIVSAYVFDCLLFFLKKIIDSFDNLFSLYSSR